MEDESRLKVGNVVSHFKRGDVKDPKSSSDYLYIIDKIAVHTETKEKLVIYTALYSNKELGVEIGNTYARPYDMFMSEVDREKYPVDKYPQYTQKYRFEKYV